MKFKDWVRELRKWRATRESVVNAQKFGCLPKNCTVLNSSIDDCISKSLANEALDSEEDL